MGNSMATAVVTSKGQVTIPLEVRQKLGLDKGDRVEFIDLGDNRFGIVAATEDVRSLKGVVRKPVTAVTVEGMNRAIAKRGASR